MHYFGSLFSKTFAVLGFQLVITFAGAKTVIAFARYLYKRGTKGFSATVVDGEADIAIERRFLGPAITIFIVLDILFFIALSLFKDYGLQYAVSVLAAWSLVSGVLIALSLIQVDENLGARVLSLTVLITLLAACIGMYSGVDFSFLDKFLTFGLMILIVVSIYRVLFGSIQGAARRAAASLGVTVFTGYLVMDFNHLHSLNNTWENDWYTAIDASVAIYLDIINLFMQLMDMLSS